MDNSPAIAAAFEMRPGRYPEHSTLDLYREVLLGLFAAWSMDPADIDGLLVPPGDMAAERPDILMHEKLLDELGIRSALSETLFAGGASYGLMIQRAALAIAAGRARAVLCVGAGKFPKSDAGVRRSMAKIFHPEFELPYGPTIPAMYGLIATRHMAVYGTTPEQLAAVAVAARQWALLHPDAYMRKRGAISVQAVLDSPLIASPFHLLDCSVPVEGGGAVLVASGDVARRINPQPAYIRGMGECHSHGFQGQAPTFDGSVGAREAGRQAFRMAGIGPETIDVVQIYDAFTMMPIVCLEELGFCARGRGGELVASGATSPGGELPMNTYGGLLSFGHVGDASGMSMIVEGCLQVMGRAGERQIAAAGTALVHSYGGMKTDHSTLILSREV
ncbi:MAG: thiolase family protein [Phycisphaerales bacterium]|nr:thiolase family protein [Phycisphaerales bacterium]